MTHWMSVRRLSWCGRWCGGVAEVYDIVHKHRARIAASSADDSNATGWLAPIRLEDGA